jgi:pimeloyl-ACP methyl ester carboxylesterase
MGPLRGASVALAASLALAACTRPALHTDGRPGGPSQITPLQSYGPWRSQVLLRLAGLRGVAVHDRVDCYRILYPSARPDGRTEILSGLLALPRGVRPRGLVSFQHGTTSDPRDAPSNLSTAGVAAAILFAGNGYAVVAPDYVGLGASRGPQPYFIADESSRAVVDLIHAARHVSGAPASAPFLTGFSEGGYASLAAQRRMEAAGEPVLADAAISGAYNLRAISIPFALKGGSPQSATYLALWVRGYAHHDRQPLESIFTGPAATLVTGLLDTPHTPDVVVKTLPRDPRALFRADALEALDGRGENWLTRALAGNEMGDWPAKAPIRFYYGSRDLDVSPADSRTAARRMAARGSNVQSVDLGPVDHTGSVLAAAPKVLNWLKSLPPA